MSGSVPWWFEYRQVFATLGGVLIGFLLATGKEWLTKKRQRRAHWSALSAEVEICREHADVYIKDRIAAPSYRLPTMAFAGSLPALLADGQVSGPELRALMEFYMHVQTFNRGLGQINEARGDIEKLNAEFQRNMLKAPRLTAGNDTYYSRAREVLSRHT